MINVTTVVGQLLGEQKSHHRKLQVYIGLVWTEAMKVSPWVGVLPWFLVLNITRYRGCKVLMEFYSLNIAGFYISSITTSDSGTSMVGYFTIAMHDALFQQNRLVYSITTAHAIWQNAKENMLHGLPGVRVNDNLVSGGSQSI